MRQANIEGNLLRWNEQHKWRKDGDEWNGQAAACGVPYDVWKASLVAHLIEPNVCPDSVVLEIAPGHGRWTEFLLRAKYVLAVDLSPACLAFCRKRFEAAGNLDLFLTSGIALPKLASGMVDFVFSYDSFVHMDRSVIGHYMHEIARVLLPGGRAIIHHANIADAESHHQDQHPGWRAAIDDGIVRDLANAAHLTVERQFTYWDEAGKIGAPRFGDRLTELRRPA